MKFWPLTILIFAPFLAAASCQTPSGAEPCDLLIKLDPQPATNRYIIANDRSFAQGVARHRGRYKAAGCK